MLLVSCIFKLSVQFNCSVVFDSLQPHRLQHSRLPCRSPPPGACSNSCPSSWWCHPTISSSVIPFSSCLQSFPASGSFPKSQFFVSGGQSIGVSASASVLLNFKSFLKNLGFLSFFNVVGFTHIKVERWFWFCKDDTHALQIFKDSANFRAYVLFSDCVLIFYMGSMVANLTTYYQPARHA